MLPRIVTLLALSASVLLAGCANMTTAYRNRSFGPLPAIVTVDAKQRSVMAAAIGEDLAICAEASPDVFSALSTSMSGEMALQPDSELQARAAIAMAEAAGTIERTQTINLLRESMYRTCERYLSGAISKSEFIVQSARDSRNMVAILAIEQLTGVVRRPSTLLVAGATSANVRSPAEAAQVVQQAVERKVDADQALASAQAAWTAAGGDTVCNPLLAADATIAPENAAKKDACLAAQTTLKAAQSESAKANGVYEAVMSMANSGALTASMSASTTPAGTSSAGGDATSGTPSARSDIALVAEAVSGIVRESNNFNEVEMMCVRIVLEDRPRNGGSATPDSVLDACLELVAAKAKINASVYMQQVAALSGVRQLNLEGVDKAKLVDEIMTALGAPPDWRTGATGRIPLGEVAAKRLRDAMTAALNANVRDQLLKRGPTIALLGLQLETLETDELARVLAALTQPKPS